jgi:N-acetylneuraminic acid mutarotase
MSRGNRPLLLCSIEPLEARRLLSGMVFGINAGGHTHEQPDGEVFLVDQGFTGGAKRTAAKPLHGTYDPVLYTTYRDGKNFIFSHKVKNGTYTLELMFYDPTSTSKGSRTMTITAEDQTIASHFDIDALAGVRGAITRTYTVTVNDGRLSLGFTGNKGKAIVSAIELRKGGPDVSYQWMDPASAPMARYEAAGVVVNDELYVLGGYRNQQIQATARCDMYDPATDTWTRIADMPEPLTHAGQAVHGTTIWLVGGFVGDNPGPGTAHVWKYNTLTNTWSRGPSLPVARGAGACAIIGDELHFFGGLDHANSSTNPVTVDYADHWVINLANSTGWKPAAPLPNPRNHLAGIALNGFVYAIGGQHLWNEDHPLSEVDQYDPATDTWKKVKSLPKPLSHISAATLTIDGRIMVIGGATTGFNSVSDVSTYNPATNKWSHFSDLPSPRFTVVAGYADGVILASTGSQFDLQADNETFSAITID